MLPITTPESGANVVLPVPISIKLYWYPTGIATEEFDGIVKVIEEDVSKSIVLFTSDSSRVKEESFVIAVEKFKIFGSISNLSSTEFQSMPFPARSQ